MLGTSDHEVGQLLQKRQELVKYFTGIELEQLKDDIASLDEQRALRDTLILFITVCQDLNKKIFAAFKRYIHQEFRRSHANDEDFQAFVTQIFTGSGDDIFGDKSILLLFSYYWQKLVGKSEKRLRYVLLRQPQIAPHILDMSQPLQSFSDCCDVFSVSLRAMMQRSGGLANLLLPEEILSAELAQQSATESLSAGVSYIEFAATNLTILLRWFSTPAEKKDLEPINTAVLQQLPDLADSAALIKLLNALPLSVCKTLLSVLPEAYFQAIGWYYNLNVMADVFSQLAADKAEVVAELMPEFTAFVNQGRFNVNDDGDSELADTDEELKQNKVSFKLLLAMLSAWQHSPDSQKIIIEEFVELNIDMVTNILQVRELMGICHLHCRAYLFNLLQLRFPMLIAGEWKNLFYIFEMLQYIDDDQLQLRPCEGIPSLRLSLILTLLEEIREIPEDQTENALYILLSNVSALHTLLIYDYLYAEFKKTVLKDIRSMTAFLIMFDAKSQRHFLRYFKKELIELAEVKEANDLNNIQSIIRLLTMLDGESQGLFLMCFREKVTGLVGGVNDLIALIKVLHSSQDLLELYSIDDLADFFEVYDQPERFMGLTSAQRGFIIEIYDRQLQRHVLSDYMKRYGQRISLKELKEFIVSEINMYNLVTRKNRGASSAPNLLREERGTFSILDCNKIADIQLRLLQLYCIEVANVARKCGRDFSAEHKSFRAFRLTPIYDFLLKVLGRCRAEVSMQEETAESLSVSCVPAVSTQDYKTGTTYKVLMQRPISEARKKLALLRKGILDRQFFQLSNKNLITWLNLLSYYECLEVLRSNILYQGLSHQTITLPIVKEFLLNFRHALYCIERLYFLFLKQFTAAELAALLNTLPEELCIALLQYDVFFIKLGKDFSWLANIAAEKRLEKVSILENRITSLTLLQNMVNQHLSSDEAVVLVLDLKEPIKEWLTTPEDIKLFLAVLDLCGVTENVVAFTTDEQLQPNSHMQLLAILSDADIEKLGENIDFATINSFLNTLNPNAAYIFLLRFAAQIANTACLPSLAHYSLLLRHVAETQHASLAIVLVDWLKSLIQSKEDFRTFLLTLNSIPEEQQTKLSELLLHFSDDAFMDYFAEMLSLAPERERFDDVSDAHKQNLLFYFFEPVLTKMPANSKDFYFYAGNMSETVAHNALLQAKLEVDIAFPVQEGFNLTSRKPLSRAAVIQEKIEMCKTFTAMKWLLAIEIVELRGQDLSQQPFCNAYHAVCRVEAALSFPTGVIYSKEDAARARQVLLSG